MSNRSKNILATAALIGMAAVASSRTLTASQPGLSPAGGVATAPAASSMVLATFNR